MSILNYFRREKRQQGEFLPSPSDFSSDLSSSVRVANQQVRNASSEPPSTKRRKVGERHTYSPKKLASIGHYTALHGPKRATVYFEKLLGHSVPESTCRKFRDAYNKEVQKQAKELGPCDTIEVTELPKKPLGRPLMLSDIDQDVQKYIKHMRLCGGVINTAVITAAATGFMLEKNKSALAEYGGSIKITTSYAKSLLSRMNFVKRKGSSAAKITPAEFDVVKKTFLEEVKAKVASGNIPDSFIFNWDQTALHLVPSSDWTMEFSGSRRVSIAGTEDKKEITALITISATGAVLPPQLLYEGKTERCHPQFTFPAEWDVWHTPNHWSNEETILRYLDKVFIPYVERRHQEAGFPPTQKALLLFDVFRGHKVQSVLTKLDEANIDHIFFPPNCTDRLQPLDVAINKPIKSFIKEKFIVWYSEQVQQQLHSGKRIEEVTVKMTLSIMKKVTCGWIVGVIDYIKSKPDMILNGFSPRNS